MVRAYKPDIIIPTFLDVDGQHGHHRAVTRATIEAYDKSDDPEMFPDDDFDPWQISQIFLPAWSGGGGSYDDEEDPPKATHFIQVGIQKAVASWVVDLEACLCRSKPYSRHPIQILVEGANGGRPDGRRPQQHRHQRLYSLRARQTHG